MPSARRVRMRRSGGLVAFRPLETEVDLTSGEDEAAVIAELLESLDMAQLAARPSPGPGADSFQYELTIDLDGEAQTFRIGDATGHPELRRLLAHLEQRALTALRASRRRPAG